MYFSIPSEHDTMTSALGDPLHQFSALNAEAWNRNTFDELARLIGARRANELAARFRSDLCDRFADVMDREWVRRDAHAVTSTAQVLGFARLSQAARSLEKACEADEAIDAKLKALMIAKFNATDALNGCLSLEQTPM
jgi:HPt (histidine-containing phosphotransfer) domain-containing protein